MLLAIDIGNSSIKFGVFDGEKLLTNFKIPSVRSQTANEINSLIGEKLIYPLQSVVASSVVPELNPAIQNFSESFFGISPLFVDAKTPTGLIVRYDPPQNLGADRYVAAFAAAGKYGSPVIICDFGTATTIDIVNSKNEFLGGIITPGITTLSDALYLKTSKLPRVEIVKPQKVIGNSTVTAIQSGIFYGYAGLVEGILQRMIAESGENPKIVATGGFADLMKENCPSIEIVNEFLMLEGLRRIGSKERC